MASRLSAEAVKRVLHQGHKSLPAVLPEDVNDLVVVDLPRIVSEPNAARIIQSLPAQQVYFALRANEMELAEDVLPLLSEEQFVRILDYDAWSHQELNITRAFRWLAHYRTNGPSGIYERYRSLDEEYQLSLVQGKVHIYDEEEREMLSDEHRDRLTAMPCNKLFYETRFDREEDAEFFEELLRSAFAGDMAYAYSLLTHAAYSVPNEAEHQLAQFRRARLEEDGFVTLEEAEQTFMPINLAKLQARWGKDVDMPSQAALTLTGEDVSELNFLDQVRVAAAASGELDISTALGLQQGFVFLANNLCAAADVGPDDPNGLCRLLEQAKALVSLGLEFLAEKDVVRGKAVLFGEHPKHLFRAGVTLVDMVRDKALVRLVERDLKCVDKLKRLLALRRWGEILWLLDTEASSTLGLQLTETLKGMFNRFPMYPIAGLKVGETKFQFKPIDSLDALNAATTALETLLEVQSH